MKRVFILFFVCLAVKGGVYSHEDSVMVKDFLIGLNFRSRLPDSIKPSIADLDYLSEYFSQPANYSESDKKYLLKIVNDTFPEKALMHRYKMSTYYEADIREEVNTILQNSEKDSLSVRDSIYQYYYNASSIDDLLYPRDIDLMLGLTDDPRFIPFLEKRYEEGYQKAAFALARMEKEPYLSRILQANVVDSIRRYGEAMYYQKHSIHYNPDLLPYICTDEALGLLVDNVMENDNIDEDHTKGVLKELSPNDETGLGRNYEYRVVRNLAYLFKHVKDSTLKADYDAYISELKNNLLREVQDLPEKEKFIYTRFIALDFPFRSSYADLQKIRAFVAQNRDRLSNPANYRCREYWPIRAGTEDFRTRHQRYR